MKMSNKTLEFTDANFKAEVLESEAPVLVDFWAEWCGPCHMLTSTMDELAESYDGSVKVGKVDIDSNPKTASIYGVMSIPTVLIFKGGEVVGSLVGVQPKRAYEEPLNKLMVS